MKEGSRDICMAPEVPTIIIHVSYQRVTMPLVSGSFLYESDNSALVLHVK
jgi:hypothetical protein